MFAAGRCGTRPLLISNMVPSNAKVSLICYKSKVFRVFLKYFPTLNVSYLSYQEKRAVLVEKHTAKQTRVMQATTRVSRCAQTQSTLVSQHGAHTINDWHQTISKLPLRSASLHVNFCSNSAVPCVSVQSRLPLHWWRTQSRDRPSSSHTARVTLLRFRWMSACVLIDSCVFYANGELIY